jgi:hypothetical protein
MFMAVVNFWPITPKQSTNPVDKSVEQMGVNQVKPLENLAATTLLNLHALTLSY